MSSESTNPRHADPAEVKAGGSNRFVRRIPIISLTLAVIALSTLVVRWRPSQKDSDLQPNQLPPIEALRSELLLEDGTLRRHGETNAFSGVMIERFRNGTLRSRSDVVDGLLHGLSEGWFTNGQRQVTEHFRRGVSHGVRTKWFSNGQKLSEATIVDGKFEGSFRQWHDNGALAAQLEFVADQPQGLSLAWFPSGALKARARMEAGKVVEQQFWKAGEREEASVRTP